MNKNLSKIVSIGVAAAMCAAITTSTFAKVPAKTPDYTKIWSGDSDKIEDPDYIKRNTYVTTAALCLRDKPNGAIVTYIPKDTSLIDLGGAPAGWSRVRVKVSGTTYRGVCGSRWLANYNPTYYEYAFVNKRTLRYNESKCMTPGYGNNIWDVVVIVGRGANKTIPVYYNGGYWHISESDVLRLGANESPKTKVLTKKTTVYSDADVKKKVKTLKSGSIVCNVGVTKKTRKIVYYDGSTLTFGYVKK